MSNPFKDIKVKEEVVELSQLEVEVIDNMEAEASAIDKAFLTGLYPPSADVANLTHKQNWGRECIKYADANNMHFLGFAIKDGEPMFQNKGNA